MRSVGRAVEQAGDVARAGETVEAIKQQLADLDAQFQAEAAAIEAGHDPASESFETIELRPNKTNISGQTRRAGLDATRPRRFRPMDPRLLTQVCENTNENTNENS